jgi:cytosine deaminase
VDLLVRNVRVGEQVVDVGIEGGRFARIRPELDADAGQVVDAEGRLATPPLVDCHLHLDASLTAGRPRYNQSGTLIEGIHVWGELKESLTADDVFARASEIVRWSAAQGTLHIRAHADVSAKNEAPLRGLLRVRDELADLVTIQVTAFPQDGIYSDPRNEELFENALRLGADCVGGIPHYEPTTELGHREVHRVFELAKQYDRRIDVHCDETDDPSSRFLEVMADNTVQHGLGGRVTASHCTAMGSYEPYYSSKLRGFLRRAGINVVVNPYANSLIQGRLDPYPKRRGFAQLKELLAEGVVGAALHVHVRAGRDSTDAGVRDDARRAHTRHRGRLRHRGGQAGGHGHLRRAVRARSDAPEARAPLGDPPRQGDSGDDAAADNPAWEGRDVYRVCGKPRSTFEVAGSGQREVTTFPRV